MKNVFNWMEVVGHGNGLTYLDADQRDDDPLQSLGMLTGHRLLQKL